jgi:hypothetical protein
MATLTGSTIADSYDQLLALPVGGINGATLVALTDGKVDGSLADHTFALELSTGEVKSTGTLTAAGAATLSTSVTLATGATVTGIDDADLATGSATLLATQGAIKTYVDAQVGASDALSEILVNGNTTGSKDIIVTTGQSITTDTVSETTVDAGVTIDSVLVKDNTVAATTFTGALVGNSDTATKVYVTDNESTAEENLISFVADAAVASGNHGLEMDGNLTYNPSTGTVTSTVFSGALTGNADTVTNGVYTTNKLSVLSATTSSELAGVISDETGSGSLVFATSPTLVTPLLGTPTSGVATNLTGTAAGLTAGTVTTNANLTGEVTSAGNAATIADDVVDEANLKVSNAPTNGYVLSAQSGDTGGLTWVDNTHAAGTVTSVSGAGTVNGLTLTGTVTSSGSLTLGGTLASVANSALTNSSVTVGTTSISLGASATTLAGLTSVTSTGFTGALTGNVTGNCSGTAATVTGATQASITSCANLVTVGTIGTGVWQGTAVDGAYVDIEGTEVKSTGESGGTKFLREDGDGTCSWQAPSGSGTVTSITPAADTGSGTAITSSGTLTFTGGTSVATSVSGTTVTINSNVLSTAQTFTAGQRGEVTALTDASTVALDFDDSNNFSLLTTSGVGATRALGNPSNLTAGQSGAITLTQDGSGSRLVTYSSYWKFVGGTAPTLTTTASAVDVLVYYVESATRITAKVLLDVK